MKINKFIDQTLLSPVATEGDIIALCNDAKRHDFQTVCVPGCYVPLASQLLKNSTVKVCTVVGFPLGYSSTETKVFEAKNAIENGADEIDMVINMGFLRSRNYVSLLKDISEVKAAIGSHPLKVILEISNLSKNEIIRACEICLDANADYIKTSTGFSKGGATLTAVKIIRKTIKDKAKIKASGGIRDFETAMKYIDLGVERIGTSSGVEIVTDSAVMDTV